MIIDLILDRKDNEALIKQGKTHFYMAGVCRDELFGGAEVIEEDGIMMTMIPLEYNAKRFYYNVFRYGEIGYGIARAMDGGDEEDVKKELCKYIMDNGYNPEICDYVNSRKWL